MTTRYLPIVLIAVTVGAAFVGVYAYALAQKPSQLSPPMTVIHIPKYSSVPPASWHNFTDLSSPTFQFPVNKTVVVGVNNTIEWVNDDSVAHTVTSFQVPTGASTFNSDLILPEKTFTVTLTGPGVYKYFCAWHNWLAGVITVKPA